MESVIFPQVSYFSLAINWRKNTVSHLLFCSISAGYVANFSDFFYFQFTDFCSDTFLGGNYFSC